MLVVKEARARQRALDERRTLIRAGIARWLSFLVASGMSIGAQRKAEGPSGHGVCSSSARDGFEWGKRVRYTAD